MYRFFLIKNGLYEYKYKGPAPSRLKIIEKAKYDSWKQLGKISKEEAMKKYIDALISLSPDWNTPKPKL